MQHSAILVQLTVTLRAKKPVSSLSLRVVCCPTIFMTVDMSIAEIAVFVIPTPLLTSEHLRRTLAEMPRNLNVVSAIHWIPPAFARFIDDPLDLHTWRLSLGNEDNCSMCSGERVRLQHAFRERLQLRLAHRVLWNSTRAARRSKSRNA
jgi:hypothetical protein